MARHVCIRVPKRGEERRADYERCPSREAWLQHCLGKDGVYVGRPKNDGGWHQAGAVKAGSMFANPFRSDDYSLEECLGRYRAFLDARLAADCCASAVTELLPPRQRDIARRRFVDCVEKHAIGKSVAHLRLGVGAEEFRNMLLDLAGRRLGCFCDEASPCHAKVLVDVVAKELQRSEARIRPRRQDQVTGDGAIQEVAGSAGSSFGADRPPKRSRTRPD
mmetsp:Transcript_109793/g.309582  ORF Transcript_109793/g.309582 Transcript_109793/m.309582 type:complete len:220 (-) Transcript_109793:34-693(-)|eukprot:CAMPEP_0117516676 /NCGR_PEP_ID=MMETSP0784-20121206/31216_1 /TAXON_ID=39447 /ORGANISM="" /LENGTH=219 /DNA_ID=CAMNT_0005312527 /DNA_START=55 /DNA_END=714 /DNA_ORIENTATION=-